MILIKLHLEDVLYFFIINIVTHLILVLSLQGRGEVPLNVILLCLCIYVCVPFQRGVSVLACVKMIDTKQP